MGVTKIGDMAYRLLIARRYFASKKQVSLVSIISGISVAGITLGTSVLIVVLSVLNGFFNLVRDLMVSFDPHVRIESAESRGFLNPDSLIQRIRSMPHVQSVAPYVEGKAQFIWGKGEHGNKVVIVRGISDHLQKGKNTVSNKMASGSLNLTRESGEPGIVLGEALANRIGIFSLNNDYGANRVELRSAAGLARSLTTFGFPDFPRFQVRGLFQMDPTYDESHVFIDLTEAQRLFRMNGKVTGIELRLDNLEVAAHIKTSLIQQLDPATFRVSTWFDIQKTLYETMLFEKWGASLILGLIILVAAFNIVGSLTMVVIEKRRDLGILQAMGVSRSHIRHIFLIEGLMIGGIGILVGTAIGLILCFLQDRFKLVPLMGGDSFIIDAYPVFVQYSDVLVIALGVLVLCILAAVYPAWRASQTEPVEAIRWE